MPNSPPKSVPNSPQKSVASSRSLRSRVSSIDSQTSSKSKTDSDNPKRRAGKPSNTRSTNSNSSKESSPDLIAAKWDLPAKTNAKKTDLPTGSSGSHTGLSQGLDDCNVSEDEERDELVIKYKSNSKTVNNSPHKHKLLSGVFDFDDGLDSEEPALKTRASDEKSVKPKIDFQKLEGRTTKTSSKLTRKLLNSPRKVCYIAVVIVSGSSSNCSSSSCGCTKTATVIVAVVAAAAAVVIRAAVVVVLTTHSLRYDMMVKYLTTYPVKKLLLI